MKKTSPCGPDTVLNIIPPPPPPSNYEPGISVNINPAPGEIRAETAVDTPRQPLDGRGMKNYAVRMTTGNPARRGAYPIRALGLTWAWGGVDFRPIRRWRRAAAFLVLCASLMAPLLGAGGSAQAAVLVSNLDKSATNLPASFSHGDRDLAQGFRTGTHADGYTLSSIEMPFGSAISAADIGDLSVSVWSVDSSGDPLMKQFDLMNPLSIAAAAYTTAETVETVTDDYAVFTGPTDKTLTQTTNYAVVLTYDQENVLWATDSTTETSAASGWSIADGGRQKPSAGSSWFEISTSLNFITTNFAILIRVNGDAKAANTAPTSADKVVITDEDTEHTFSSADFPFTDMVGDSLSSVKIVTLPATGKGTLTLSGTAITSGDLPKTVTTAQIGTLKYVPPANDNGAALASFTFRVNDGTADSVATNTMTVNVTAINDPPTGKPEITGTARVGQVLMATVGTIADPDGLPDPFLTDTSTSFQWVRVTSGTGADISGATASTYTLVDTDNGQTISVKVSFQDDDGTDEGPLTSDAYPSGAGETVLPASTNNPPTSADKTVGTPEDTEYTFSSADFPFTDTADAGSLSSVKIVTLPAPGKGTLTLSGTAITSGDLPKTVTAVDLAADNLKYVPPANESGNSLASFTFRVNDGTDNSATPNTVTVNVTAVNDAATGQPGIDGTARVGQVLTATVGTIADPDGLPDPFFASGTTTVQWIRVDGGNETDIPSATDFTYTLVDADEGKTIKVKVVSFNDEPGFANGPLTSDAYPSGGTVLPALSTNAAPTSADKTVGTPEDTYTYTYTFSSTDFPFTDTDGDSLSSVKIVSLPARGTLTLSGTALTSGELPQTVGAAQIGTLKYVPPANESGLVSASFTFRVNDGTDDSVATYTMTVTKTYTVTVTVSGEFLGPWMARFGRTVADQVLGSVGDRLMAPRTSGTEVRLAGHWLGAVDRDTSDQASGENTARAGTIGREVEAKAAGKVAREAEKEAERKMAVGLRALTNRLDGDGNYGKSGHDGLFGGFEAREAAKKSRGITGREMLTGSAFTLTKDTAGGNHGARWGRGAVSSFDGRTGGFGLDGEVVSVILGIDRTKGPAVVGVALGHSRGEGDYRSEAGEPANGEIVTTLTGLYPYAHHEVNERLSVWGVVGHGLGRMMLTPEGLAPMETNAHLVMATLGVRGVLRQPLDGIGLELAVRSDALAVRTTTKALRGSGINLAAMAAEVTRLRLGLEGTWHNALPSRLVPTFEIGVRYDGGDAETGFGADLGAGLTWADPVRGIRAEFHARGLVGHEDDGFRELGLSGSLFWDAMPDSDLGWSLGIAQAMGARATGGMDALLNPDTPRVFGFDETVDSSDSLHDDDLDRRLAADLGYGFAMFGGRYTGTPAVGLRLSEDGREMVLGWSLAESQESGLVFGLDVAGRRHESVGGEPGHSFGGGFGWQRAGERSGEPGFGVRFEGERLAADRDGEPEHRFGVQMTARW